ncbi:MAG: hypothetical protein FWB78_00275 [Treponema sp.]|nr:hypothetical protein [Treponema sp.]
MEKIISTSCPFPLKKLNVNLKYAAVQKPSGVGYIILELIKDAKSRNVLFHDVLKRFGVPEDLQFIFVEEIEVLVNREILRMRQGNTYKREYFEQYEIAHFEFTPNGERMFREGYIPTGDEKAKQLTLYYNPMLSLFSFNNGARHKPIESSACYTKDFLGRLETDLSGLKDYLVENINQTGLQKEERLLDCSILDDEYVITSADKNLELHIDNDGMEINLKTAGAEAFYEEYFSPEMLENELSSKDMFRFNVRVYPVRKFASLKNLSAVYPPEEYAKQLSRPAEILLTHNKDVFNVKCGSDTTPLDGGKIITTTINELYPNWSFIAIDANKVRLYTAACVKIMERVINKSVGVNLLLEQNYGLEQRYNIFDAIFNECKAVAFSKKHCSLIKSISGLVKKADFTVGYIKAKLAGTDDLESQVSILLEANNVFSGPAWMAAAKSIANDIYNGFISKLTSENVRSTVKIAKTLDGIRQLSEKDQLLTDVFEKLKSHTSDEIELFNFLVNGGFSENEALSVTNVVKVYVEKILAGGAVEIKKSRVSDDFSVLLGSLNDLRENLGIKSTIKYAIREGYNITEFIENFRVFQSKLLQIEKYAGFASEGFKELSKYNEIMQPIFDYIMVERNASQMPHKINENYVRQAINRGDWRMAIGNMVIRLDYVLCNLLKIKSGDTTLFDKMKRAEKEQILTESQTNILHELREFRNRLEHPTEEQLVFDKNKISEWADSLFSIGENKKGEEK